MCSALKERRSLPPHHFSKSRLTVLKRFSARAHSSMSRGIMKYLPSDWLNLNTYSLCWTWFLRLSNIWCCLWWFDAIEMVLTRCEHWLFKVINKLKLRLLDSASVWSHYVIILRECFYKTKDNEVVFSLIEQLFYWLPCKTSWWWINDMPKLCLSMSHVFCFCFFLLTQFPQIWSFFLFHVKLGCTTLHLVNNFLVFQTSFLEEWYIKG